MKTYFNTLLSGVVLVALIGLFGLTSFEVLAQNDCNIRYGRVITVKSSGRGNNACDFRGRAGDQIYASCTGCDDFSLYDDNFNLIRDSRSTSFLGPSEIEFTLSYTGKYSLEFIYDFGSHQEPATDNNGNSYYQYIEDPGSLSITLERVSTKSATTTSEATGVSLFDLADKVPSDDAYISEGLVGREKSSELLTVEEILSNIYNEGYETWYSAYAKFVEASSMIGRYYKIWIPEPDSCTLRSIQLSVNLFNDSSGPLIYFNDLDFRQALIDEGFYDEVTFNDNVLLGKSTFDTEQCGVLLSRDIRIAYDQYLIGVTLNYREEAFDQQEADNIIMAKIQDVIATLQ